MNSSFEALNFDDLDVVDCLALGDVVYIEHEDVEGVHYMAVLNTVPEANEVLVLGVLTTKIEKRKKFLKLTNKDPRSLVEFDYIKPSAIDCNNLKEISKELLREKLKSPGFRIGEPLKEDLVKQIIEAVLIGDAPQRLKDLVKNSTTVFFDKTSSHR